MKPAPHPLETTDLSYFWMSSATSRQHKATPCLLTPVQGTRYRDGDGREVLDGTTDLWCVNADHCRKEIVGAVITQAAALDLAPTFQMGHPLALCMAEKVTEIMPEGLNHIFPADPGPEAVGTVLKIALAYHRVRGEGQRTRLIGRERSYHGMSPGGISVGGISPDRKVFSVNLLPGVGHLPHACTSEHSVFSKGQPAWGERLVDGLGCLVTLHDVSTIAVVIVEPLAGSTGVLASPKGYLRRLRALCNKYDILLIFDEVITGSGRPGAATAAELSGVMSDLLTMAKDINNAIAPMGAVAVRQSVHDTVVDAGAPGAIELSHGYTYSAHPLAAVVAVATLDLYHNEELFKYACSLSPVFEAAAHSVKSTPHVKGIRDLGFMADIELESRPGAMDARAYEIFLKCLEHGVLMCYTDNILAFSPPLIIEEAQITRISDVVRIVL